VPGPIAGRVLSALLPAAGGFLRTLGRAARQLLLEVSGALFALFAVLGAVSTWRAWQQSSGVWVIAVSVGFTLFMGFFCVTSFWKASRIQKSNQ
jgi:hypothetical protein